MKIYSTLEASKRIGITRQRLHQLIQAGKIAVEWIGKTRVIYEIELNRFLKQRRE